MSNNFFLFYRNYKAYTATESAKLAVFEILQNDFLKHKHF